MRKGKEEERIREGRGRESNKREGRRWREKREKRGRIWRKRTAKEWKRWDTEVHLGGKERPTKRIFDQVLNFWDFCTHPIAHHDQTWSQWVNLCCAPFTLISAWLVLYCRPHGSKGDERPRFWPTFEIRGLVYPCPSSTRTKFSLRECTRGATVRILRLDQILMLRPCGTENRRSIYRCIFDQTFNFWGSCTHPLPIRPNVSRAMPYCSLSCQLKFYLDRCLPLPWMAKNQFCNFGVSITHALFRAKFHLHRFMLSPLRERKNEFDLVSTSAFCSGTT